MSSAIDRNLKLEQTQLEFMKFVPLVLKKHELVTGFHVEHTVTYVRMLCYKLKEQGYYKDELSQKNIELFSAAANLHDIGDLHSGPHSYEACKIYGAGIRDDEKTSGYWLRDNSGDA